MCVAGILGCASPGPPRPPSLQLPQLVRDLSAERDGDAVRVRFTTPQRTTDGLPIPEASLTATLCRGAEGAPCVPVRGLRDVSLPVNQAATAAQRTVTWTDRLPAADTTGEPRLLLYRVELKNQHNRTAGWSEPAYTAAGAAPAAVVGLRAQETPAGILLRWTPPATASTDEVLLRRVSIAAVPATPGPTRAARPQQPLWLESHATAAETLDTTAAEDVPFRYTAVRRRIVEAGARKLELRSAPSTPVDITWRNLFPPPAPASLSAATVQQPGQFAVDLVWQPVEQPGLKGYVITRQAIDAGGAPLGPSGRLATVTLPAFHDATASPSARYRYTVRAISKKDVDGAAATVLVAPNQ